MKKALDFISRHKDVVFATVDGNMPKLRVLQIMKQEGAVFYFAVNSEKEVYQQLQSNNNVEFVAMDSNISVRVVGYVLFNVSDAVAQEIYDNNPVLRRFHDSYKTIAYFKLVAAKIDYYNLGTNPVTFDTFSFIHGK